MAGFYRSVIALFLLGATAGALAAVLPSAQRQLPSIPAYERNQVKNTLLRDVANPLQECFKKWSAKEKAFSSGKVVLDWEILPSGSVRSVRVIHSDLAGLNACAVRLVSKAKFPSPPDGKPYYVSHNFLFKNVE